MGAEASSIQNSAAGIQACRACKESGDKQTDTVKVDLDKIRDTSAGKENNPLPGEMIMKETAAQRQQRADQEKLAQDEALRQRDEQDRLRQEEERRVQMQQRGEERRRQEEAERQRQLDVLRKKQQDEEAKRQAEEARRIKIEKIAAEEERRRQLELDRQKAELIEQKRVQEQAERQRREEEKALAAKQKLEMARKQQLLRFLEKEGFSAHNERKVKKGLVGSSFSYPLHAAVEAKDDKAVELLLWAGADPKLPNSKKQTPLALAQAKNTKQGSHMKVIALLTA